MKKVITLVAMAALSGCVATHYEECQPKKQQPCPEVVTYQEVKRAPQPEYMYYNPCRCVYRPDNSRPVLRPRVKEEVVVKQNRRNCPPDNQMVNCGCGYCKTFQQQPMPAANVGQEVRVNNYSVVDYVAPQGLVPVMPEAYTLASNRTLNRMLKDTALIYQQSPDIKLFIKEASLDAADLPQGSEAGVKSMKRQLQNSRTFNVVDDISQADYYLETKINWLDTPSKTVPAIKYQVKLFDTKGKQINEWVEVIKQADNSKIWL